MRSLWPAGRSIPAVYAAGSTLRGLEATRHSRRASMMTVTSPDSRNDSTLSPTIARLKARKETRRKREIALLLLSGVFVLAAFALGEPALILISVFPALASYGQR